MTHVKSKPGLGHNSGTTPLEWSKFEASEGITKNLPHNVKTKETLWRAAESNMARRERVRLMKSDVIRPAYLMPPQLMVKDDEGNWKPEIKIYG